MNDKPVLINIKGVYKDFDVNRINYKTILIKLKCIRFKKYFYI